MIHFILSNFFVFLENNFISGSYEHQIAAVKTGLVTEGKIEVKIEDKIKGMVEDHIGDKFEE